MFRLTDFQIYAMMVMLVSPVAFLETPRRLILFLLNNGWLAALAAIIPGFLLVAMLVFILNRSTRPFPFLLEEHLGKIAGKILACFYIVLFFLVSTYSLRHFTDFIISNVMPGTPISVLIGLFLLMGFFAIRSGLENIARLCELFILLGLPFVFLILLDNLACLGFIGRWRCFFHILYKGGSLFYR